MVGGWWKRDYDYRENHHAVSGLLIVDNLPPRPFGIRMVRVTADSTTDQLQNNTVYGRRIPKDWLMSGSAIPIRGDWPAGESEQFGSQRVTRVPFFGRIIQVPSNYDQ